MARVRIMRAVVAIAVAVLSARVSHAQLQSWPVGEERELQPGYYTKVLARQDGWTTFRVESRDGVRCFTQKAQTGEGLPVPYKDFVLVLSEPHVQIGGGYDGTGSRAWWGIKGREEGDAEYRFIGERFMKEVGIINRDFAGLDGEVIEFKYEGWEYPSLLVGYYSAEGEFDLTGMSAARARHERLCREAAGVEVDAGKPDQEGSSRPSLH